MNNWENQEEHESKNEKVTMADRFLIAMFSPKEYDKLLKLPMKNVITFLLCLISLLTIVQAVIPTFGAVAGMGGMKNLILNRIPDFELKDGKFFYADRYEVNDEQSGIYILVDTDQEEFVDSDLKREANTVETILVSRTNMLVSNYIGGVEALRQNYQFKDFGDFYVSNESLTNYIPFFYLCMIIGCVFSFFILLIRYLVSALCYAAFIYAIERFLLQKTIQFGQTYLVAIFAKTVGTIVLAVAICAGTTLIIMAADSFAVFTTVIIMNKVCVHKYLAV